jgi:general secretion pathway protein J
MSRAVHRRHPLPAPASRGFTLVEVLVALFIMAVLAGLAWRGVDALVRARDGSQAVIETTQRLNTVLTQWEQDLAAVHDSASVPALTFDGRTLRLVRTADGGVRLVAWALHEGSWQRWTGPPTTRVAALQESWLASQQLLGNEPGQLKVLTGVDSFQVFFYRGNAWTNAQSTGDVVARRQPQAPQPRAPQPPASAASGVPPDPDVGGAADREQLPGAVRLVLGIDGRRLTRDIALGPQMP